MNPNGRFSTRKVALPGELSDAQGGALVNKVPTPIPWEAFIGCGIRVFHEGKPAVFMLDLQTLSAEAKECHFIANLDDINESVGVILLLIGMLVPKQGPLDWATVPENVKRHFREVDTTTKQQPT